MSPKPILKRTETEPIHNTEDPCGHPNRTHAVRFPPCPATCTFSVYSAAAYDRSPIVVTPNNCALPERGCPGRTYTLGESQPRRGITYARDFHPRALAFASTRSSSPCSFINATDGERSSVYPALPQLIPDFSSESDESDSFFGFPTLSTTSPPTFGIHGLAGPSLKYGSDAYNDVDIDDCNALAFLPHPPSPPSHKHQYAESIDPPSQNYRRRRGERESKHESSRDPDRIPGCSLSAFSSLSISSSTSPGTQKRRTKQRLSQSSPSFTPISLSFDDLDDGCLGGF